MGKQKMYHFLAIILFLIVLIGGPSLSMAAYSGEGQKTLILKIGSEIPLNDIVSQAPIRFAERMKQRTNDKIQITYFADSQLGRWQQLLESVKTGSIAMMYSPAGGSKEYYVIQLPFVFRDLDHAVKVMDGELREEWTKKHLEKTGIYIFGWEFSGWHSIFTTKVPVRTPADMKGMKFRVPQDANFIETFLAIGARPTPIPFSELYLSLRQGVADGLAVPLDPIIALKFWEVVKYGTLTHHMISAHLMHLNGQVWESLTPETRKIWMDTWKEVTGELKKDLIKKEQDDVSLLKSKGITFTDPDIEAFREATKDVWKKLLSEPGEIEAYEKIKATR
jgi:tripartite ATP-independent transporter DctP family solute receptor